MVVSHVSTHNTPRLAWGHSGADGGALVVCSYKVQLIHRIKEAEAPEEMKTGESVPSRSQSTPVGAADAADDVPQPAIDEHARSVCRSMSRHGA